MSYSSLADSFPPDCRIPHLENNHYIYGGPVPFQRFPPHLVNSEVNSHFEKNSSDRSHTYKETNSVKKDLLRVPANLFSQYSRNSTPNTSNNEMYKNSESLRKDSESKYLRNEDLTKNSTRFNSPLGKKSLDKMESLYQSVQKYERPQYKETEVTRKTQYTEEVDRQNEFERLRQIEYERIRELERAQELERRREIEFQRNQERQREIYEERVLYSNYSPSHHSDDALRESRLNFETQHQRLREDFQRESQNYQQHRTEPREDSRHLKSVDKNDHSRKSRSSQKGRNRPDSHQKLNQSQKISEAAKNKANNYLRNISKKTYTKPTFAYQVKTMENMPYTFVDPSHFSQSSQARPL